MPFWEHWPGEKLLERIWTSTVDQGIGGLLKPWQTKRVARAELVVECERIRELAIVSQEAAQISSIKTSLIAAPDSGPPSPTEGQDLVQRGLIEQASKARETSVVREEVNVASSVL